MNMLYVRHAGMHACTKKWPPPMGRKAYSIARSIDWIGV